MIYQVPAIQTKEKKNYFKKNCKLILLSEIFFFFLFFLPSKSPPPCFLYSFSVLPVAEDKYLICKEHEVNEVRLIYDIMISAFLI